MKRKPIRRRALRLHVAVASGQSDYRGVAICTCGSASDASVHGVAERTDDERQHEARKVGERGDQAD